MAIISSQITNRQDFFENLFEAISYGIVVIDDDGRVMAANSRLKQILGLSFNNPTDLHICNFLGCGNKEQTSLEYIPAGRCAECGIRYAAAEAFSGKSTTYGAPFNYMNKKLAVISIDNAILENSPLYTRKESGIFPGILSHDPGMMEIFEIIKRVSEVDVPVLIQGESGTGKELVANAIHENSARANNHFVAINCAALPEGILESELFGHIKGAFTGAFKNKIGRFEMAHKGTIFLDEVADLSKRVQAKLLRVLQEGTFERVGGEKLITVDMRIISATNRNLKTEVSKGNFREDLYYRLNVVPIDLPPLRKRKDDISLLARHFIREITGGPDAGVSISEDALDILNQHSWPGNIRELQSTIRYALIKSKGEKIQPDHLPQELREKTFLDTTRGPSRKLNRDRVRSALERSGGNKSKAAKSLGVGRATLYRFMDNVLNSA